MKQQSFWLNRQDRHFCFPSSLLCLWPSFRLSCYSFYLHYQPPFILYRVYRVIIEYNSLVGCLSVCDKYCVVNGTYCWPFGELWFLSNPSLPSGFSDEWIWCGRITSQLRLESSSTFLVLGSLFKLCTYPFREGKKIKKKTGKVASGRHTDLRMKFLEDESLWALTTFLVCFHSLCRVIQVLE